MSVVRRNDGGVGVPRPRGSVHEKDGVEKRATRPSWKNNLEVSAGMVTTHCGFILQISRIRERAGE